MKKSTLCTVLTLLLIVCNISAQESLKSTEEEYYNFLSLTGTVNRPTLNYRTLSDSVWTFNDQSTTNHVWQNNNLGSIFTLFTPETESTNRFVKGLKQGLFLKVYGPEWFNSFNTEAPYGQNDGALWQGKGYNTSLTTGLRLEGYGFEVTFKPQLTFSQNLAFEIMDSNYDSQYGYFWGYEPNVGVDTPQRFGNEAFFTFDWGDTEIRYTWNTLTIGFGTQAIWLGPAQLNPILHSNNAPSYPKVDIGLRRQPITLPWLDWYIGDIEGRIWTGYLSESDYFDSDSSNDHNMINAMSLSYAPSFLEGLTLGVNRVFLTKWKLSNLKYLGELLFISLDNSEQVQGNENQMVSLTADWIFPKVGFEVYAEIGIDDYVPGKMGYLRYPFHTLVYTAGLTKTMTLSETKGLHGKLLFEITNLEMSQDFQFQWPYTFYAHHQITQGYTNDGQWLGAGNGTGGNSQYLGFTLYYPKGNTTIFLHRSNPDNNYLYKNAVYNSANVDDENGENLDDKYFTNWKASIVLGVNTKYFVTKNLVISGGAGYNLILNPLYENNGFANDIKLHNFIFQLGLKYNF
jgi:hypothetical protein